jgi:transketolase
MKKYDFINPDMKESRQGFADALLELGKENRNVVVLGGDVTGSVKTNLFRDAFPERFISVGISEQDMMGTAAGLATVGKIPFASTYGEFATGRPYDQIRQSIGYSKTNVKICASHCGISVGPDGATHQSLEDVALMRVLPNMIVVTPCDYNETFKAVKKCVEINSPFYIRFYRDKSPNFSNFNLEIEIGKAVLLEEGNDVTLIANGLMVWEALIASYKLKEQGINSRVINMHTIKPIDENIIIESAIKTGLIITCEDHQKFCGLYSAVAEVTSLHYPVKIDFIAINDTFGESGTMKELMRKYNLDSKAIVDKVLKHINK